jgi:cytochrome c oxidase subunit 3
MEIPYTVHARPDTGLYNAKVGIWLFLASEVMLFGALFSAYILLRVGAPEGYWPHGWLNVPIGTVNTLVLITSSITTVMGFVQDEPVRTV